MSNHVDFDIGTMQGLTDSLKEALKQAMLRHEIVFRNQVIELHRLYWMQRNLMNDLCWRDFGENAMLTPNLVPPQAGNSFLMCPSMMMSSTLLENSNTFEESSGYTSRLHHAPERNFILELPFDVYSKDATTKYFKKQNPHSSRALDGSDPEELELTLGSKKKENNEKRGARITLFGKESCLPAQDVIDLAESEEFAFNKEAIISSSFSSRTHIAHSACTTGARLPALSDLTFADRTRPTKFDSNKEVSVASTCHFQTHVGHNPSAFGAWLPASSDVISPGRTRNEIMPKSSVCHPDADHGERLQENSSLHLNLGLNNSSGCLSSDILIQEQCSSSCKPLCFDLNKSQVKESPENSQNQGNCNRNEDNPVVLRSHSQVLSETCGKSKGGLLGIFDGVGAANASGSPSLSPGIYNLHDEDSDTSLGLLGCDTQSQRQIVSTVSSNKKEENCSGQSLEINSLSIVSSKSELKQANCERSEEDTGSFSPPENLMSVEGTVSASLGKLQHGHYGDDPTGGKCTNRNRICNRRHTEAGGLNVLSVSYDTQGSQVSLVVGEKCSGEQKVNTEADVHAALLEKTCRCSELHPAEDLERKENPTAETDCTIWKAAESLIHISLFLHDAIDSSDDVAKIGHTESENKEGSDQPQYSSDSFEAIALALTENVNDEYSMPCKLTKEEAGKGARRFKLRRGRGLHDFQKEILPGLISLSRHEICEDLHSIAEAVRLHKLREGDSMLCKGNWFAPMRRRRSRLNYVV